MAKTIYDYWFTQFDFPDEDGKPYRSSGGKMVWCNKISGNIPENWSLLKLSDVIKHINTGLNPRDNFILGNGAIRYITVKNLTNNGDIDFSKCDTVDQEAHNVIHKRSDISVGDILFASIAPLGRCYLIQNEPFDWDINESVFSIRPNIDIVTSEYLLMFLTSSQFVSKAQASSTGSIFKGIRIGTLLEMDILIPPMSIIQTFSKKISTLLKTRAENSMETSDLTSLRDWLLPMLMNGQATIAD